MQAALKSFNAKMPADLKDRPAGDAVEHGTEGRRQQAPLLDQENGFGGALGDEPLGVEQDGVFQAAFLHIQARRAAYIEGVRRLLVEIDGPFVLVALTERFRDVAVQELLQARGIGFISLEDEILLDDNGRFVAVDPVSADDEHPVTPPADRERVVNAFCQKYDIPKTKAADAAEVVPTDLYKWMRDELPKKSKKCVLSVRVRRAAAGVISRGNRSAQNPAYRGAPNLHPPSNFGFADAGAV